MSTKAEAYRTSIAVLTALLAIEEGKPAGTYLGQILPKFDTDEAERQRLADIASRMKPHDFVALAPGTGGYAGDNDKPDDELFRTHGPFMKAATDIGWLDSKGERFTVQTVKNRGTREVGFGKPAWDYVRAEVRRLQLTPEGFAWQNNPANLAAGIVPRGLA